MVREILLLGDPRLERVSREVTQHRLAEMAALRDDLQDTLRAFRQKHGAGRGIAAPQIGRAVRVIYLDWPEPRLLINPTVDQCSRETMELWDDCMSFPELLVHVSRHRSCRLRYRDMGWRRREITARGDLSELLQHEVDHLDGILAVSRVAKPGAFALRREFERAGGLPQPGAL